MTGRLRRLALTSFVPMSQREVAPVWTGHPAELGGLGDILKHVLMSDDYQRIELITGTARRRRWTTEQKLRIIEASYEPGESVSSGCAAAWGGAEPSLSMAALDGGGRRGSGGIG
jgi:hypothetical protein